MSATPGTRRRQRGAALLAVVMLVAVAAAMSAALLERTRATAAELRARRDVLCARYAALGGLALAASDAGALDDARVESLVVARVRAGPAWCLLRATASCGDARRTIDRTMADASACP